MANACCSLHGAFAEWLTGHGQKLNVGLKVRRYEQRRWRCRDHVGFLVLIEDLPRRIAFGHLPRSAPCPMRRDDGRCQESACSWPLMRSRLDFCSTRLQSARRCDGRQRLRVGEVAKTPEAIQTAGSSIPPAATR